MRFTLTFAEPPKPMSIRLITYYLLLARSAIPLQLISIDQQNNSDCKLLIGCY